MKYKTLNEIENLVLAFENCTLPREKWSHSAHLTIALWYLTHFSEQDAIKCICDRIQKYNAANGIETTKHSGYHETITLFWVRIIIQFLANTAGKYSVLDLANKLIHSYANPRLPLEYYSRNLLMSWEARISWVEPNLKSSNTHNF
ncbi:MAG TPA: hypothetical protein DEV81_03520 [Cyanobacteria bacterium UBA11049]|nr:hypothetical protein [Cyanobacteria bacterium UBA11049]